MVFHSYLFPIACDHCPVRSDGSFRAVDLQEFQISFFGILQDKTPKSTDTMRGYTAGGGRHG
jgi:hypothetical protein